MAFNVQANQGWEYRVQDPALFQGFRVYNRFNFSRSNAASFDYASANIVADLFGVYLREENGSWLYQVKMGNETIGRAWIEHTSHHKKRGYNLYSHRFEIRPGFLNYNKLMELSRYCHWYVYTKASLSIYYALYGYRQRYWKVIGAGPTEIAKPGSCPEEVLPQFTEID